MLSNVHTHRLCSLLKISSPSPTAQDTVCLLGVSLPLSPLSAPHCLYPSMSKQEVMKLQVLTSSVFFQFKDLCCCSSLALICEERYFCRWLRCRELLFEYELLCFLSFFLFIWCLPTDVCAESQHTLWGMQEKGEEAAPGDWRYCSLAWPSSLEKVPTFSYGSPSPFLSQRIWWPFLLSSVVKKNVIFGFSGPSHHTCLSVTKIQ